MPLEQDAKFYDILDAQADLASKAVSEFRAVAQNFKGTAEYAQRIKQIEEDGDKQTRQLIHLADDTFVTPLDKEDVLGLTTALDDIIDCVEAAAARLAIYQIDTPRQDLTPLVDLLAQSVDHVKDAVGRLRHKKQLRETLAILEQIHDLEKKTDAAYRQALADLFRQERENPLLIIEWKDIYDRVEIASDKCEDAADILERVVIKYA
jgi:predicted phosphate transport protein (TIGR00153 family)